MFLKQKPNRTIAVASACLAAFLFCCVGSSPVLAAEEWVCSSNPASAETPKSSAKKFEVGLQTPFSVVPKLECLKRDGKDQSCTEYKSKNITCNSSGAGDKKKYSCTGSEGEFKCGVEGDPTLCKFKLHEYRFNPGTGVFQEIIRGETGSDIIMTYSKYLYTFLSVTIGVISVLMLVVGGIQISIAGASQEGLTQGKDRITSALVGLMLLFLSSLVLYTINPNFYSLDAGPGKSSAPSATTSAPETWVCESGTTKPACSSKNAPAACYSGDTSGIQHKNSGVCEMETPGSSALGAVCVDLKLAGGCTTKDVQNKLRTYPDIYANLDAECAAADGFYGQCTRDALQNFYEAYYCQN